MKPCFSSLFRTLLVSVAISMLAACSSESLTSSASLLMEGKVADSIVQSGAPVETVFTAQLSEQEAKRVIAAMDYYEQLREKWTGAPDSAAGTLNAVLSIAGDYANLYGEYTAVKQIVQAHWDEYPPAQQAKLIAYDDLAGSIHGSMQTLIEQRREAEASSTMLRLGVLIAQTAAQ
jgi:hypothetical protein